MNSLIFVGDIASPDEKCSNDLKQSIIASLDIFRGNFLIANLEGLINDIPIEVSKPVMFNHPSVLDPLVLLNTKAVSLANNHSLDLPDNFSSTVSCLKNKKIQYFGIGREICEAEKPATVFIKNKEVLVFGFCWEVMMQHQKNQPGILYVNPLKPFRILQQVKETRVDKPNAVIILTMHWNFDFETLPFPFYRQLSKDLIDAGADAVIGSHSHVIQGAERYKNGIIFYGLGNFYVPWNTYMNGTLTFPEISRESVALEWNPVTGEALLHWFIYDILQDTHKLTYIETEDFDSSERLRYYTPYRNLDEKQYVKYFAANRRKNFILPVYRNYKETSRNYLIDKYLVYRIRVARLLSKLKIRDWNN